MKKIIMICGLVGLFGGVASAASSSEIGVLESSVTVNTVAVSSFTPTQMVPAAIAMPDRVVIMIQNVDPDNDMYCSEKANMTTSSNSFLLVKGGGSISINIRNYSPVTRGPLTFYCLTAKTTGTSNATVVQAY